ncbi:MAG: hypothetical protein HZB26_08510, partial [Candidatus Hydrogenedentes bacterium]|nr:hypothetical protein [Candidatus Hydrogenedentota bacterium]
MIEPGLDGDLVIISKHGQMIRLPLQQIPSIG